MCREDNPGLATLGRYADALTAELAERGDPRVFTVESLQAGPDPVLLGEAPQAEAEAPGPSEIAQALIREALARNLPLETAAGWAPGAELAPTEQVMVRVRDLGEVPCGTPVDLSDRGMGRMVTVDRSTLGPRWRADTCFIITARGNSMVGYQIPDGAQLTVDSDMPWRSGDIVVAWVNGGTAVRRIVAVDDGYELQPGAEGYRTIHVTSRDEARVVGVVVWVQPAGWAPG